MATKCSKLAASFLVDCNNKPVGGAEDTLWAITKDDWNDATIAYDATNPNIITGITLAAGAKAYKFEVFKKGHKPKFEFQDTDYGVKYKHSIATSIQNWTQEVKDNIAALGDDYLVFIVENVQKRGIAFEVYGADNGLRMPDGVRDLAANDGVLTGTFTNDEGYNESRPPLTLAYTGGYSATKAALETLAGETVTP